MLLSQKLGRTYPLAEKITKNIDKREKSYWKELRKSSKTQKSLRGVAGKPIDPHVVALKNVWFFIESNFIIFDDMWD